jgi:hypothetical protein
MTSIRFSIFFQAETPPEVQHQGFGSAFTVVKNLIELWAGR